MPKITETDIIKRTALLKFLQILDGFHTPTEKKKLIFFSSSNFKILKKFNLSKILKKLPKAIKSDLADSKMETFFWQTSAVVSPQIKPKKSTYTELGQKTNISKAMRGNPKFSYLATLKSKINYKLSLSIKNFWDPFIWPKKLKTAVVSKNRLKNTAFYLKPKCPADSSRLGIWPSFFNKLKNDAPFNFRWAGLNQNHQMLVSLQASLYERKLYNNNIFFSRQSRVFKPKIDDKKKWILDRQKFLASASTLSFPMAWYISSNIQNIHGIKPQVESRPLANYETSVFRKKQRFSSNESKDLIAKELVFKLSFSVFEPILRIKGIPKYEIYLKNQSSNKSLNLLCVWPSYLEDILGPFNLNDSGSYILPEYFQLLGHGPKLKKQGITLIASTNNLTNLDAALLRPGRFDTIINFSYSFSSIYRSSKMLKHSACLTQNNLFSYYKLYTREKNTELDLNSLKGGKPFKSKAKYDPDLIWHRIYPSEFFFINPDAALSVVSQRQASLVVSHFAKQWSETQLSIAKRWGRTQKSWIKPSTHFSRPNIWAHCVTPLKNNFYSQLTTFDKTNQSTAMKTFLDVSIFIHHKLWWSFYNEKSFWPVIDQKITRVFPKNGTAAFLNIQKGESLIQKSRTQVSDSEKLKLKTLFFNIYNGLLVLAVKTLVKLKDLTYIFIDILRMIYFKFFYNIFKFFIIFKNLLNNQKIITSQSASNKNFDFITVLSREVLISKMLTLGLSKKLNSFGFHPIASLNLKQQTEPAETFNLANDKKKTSQNFRSQVYTEDNNIFLKSNRSFLFCTGDFNYKISSPTLFKEETGRAATEKNDSIVLLKEKSYKKKYRWANTQLTLSNRLFSPNNFSHSVGITNSFLDPSSKTWKPLEATAVKNVKINHVKLTKYNQIYKLKKIKSKQFFFNLHPFTCLILKRWLEITKFNKLKPYLKVPLAKNILPQFNVLLYLKNKQNASIIKNFWFLNLQASSLNKKSLHNQIYNNLYSMTLLTPTNNSWLTTAYNKNKLFLQDRPIISKPAKSSNKIHINLKENTNMYEAIECKTIEKELLKTIPTNHFFSTHESYLFKKLSTNSSLNITCLQTYWTLINSGHNSWISSIELPQVYSRLKKIPRKTMLSDKPNYFQGRCKIKTFNATTNQFEINNNIILLKNLKEFFVPDFVSHKIKKLFVQAKIVDSPSTLLSMVLSDETSLSKNKDTVPLKVTHSLPEDVNSAMLCQALSTVSFQAKQWEETQKVNHRRKLMKQWESIQNYKMCRLDISFFILTFYTMFFEKIQTKNVNFLSTFLSILVSKQNKNMTPPVVSLNMKSWAKTQPSQITLNTIKIFMPYKSLIISHFLLSQSNTYNFSCKNFEILIYNKFKNFLVDF